MKSTENNSESAAHVNRRTFLRSAAVTGLAMNLGPSLAATATEKPIKVGLIGRDGHVDMLFGSLPKLEGVTLEAFAKSRPEEDASWVRKQKEFVPGARIYSDFRQMLDKERLDVVTVCLPYYRNAEASTEAARRGIHIFSEKPVATTLEDLDRLEQAVRENHVQISAMFALRAEPAFQAARQAVLDGLIGRPLMVSGQKSYKFGTVRPWFYKERRTYGGTIPWVGIHAIDFMRWVSGVEFVKVAAHHGNGAHPDYPGCEDHAALTFVLANGGSGVCNLDFLRPAGASTHGDDRLRVAGTKGVVEVVGNQHRAFLITADSAARDLPLPPPTDLFADFIGGLRGDERKIAGPDEAIRVTRISLIARNAADAGQWMDL